MAVRALVAFSVLAGTAKALELTEATWDAQTAGKSVFVKFFAPWCGHCKGMKPAWDKLMSEFEGSSTSLVADVDCTADGKSLCDKSSVQGFPTIKYGDPTDLKDYQGGRDFESLKAFADQNLGPQCGPDNMDLCSERIKKKLQDYLAMSADRLEAKVAKAYTAVEEDIPLMKKVIGHLKSAKKEL